MGNIMSLTLHFGVIDIPYTYKQQTLTKKGKIAKRMRTIKVSTTTGEVADWIEEDYHLMEHFYEDNKDKIADELTKSLDGAMEAVLTGAPVIQDPYGAATSELEDLFKKTLMMSGFDGRIPGVPTVASGRVPSVRKGGVNHRLARPYAKSNPARPSFIDTGTFESSFKMWVEGGE